MRTEIIDFKEKKIRRCYDANIIDIDFTFDIDKNGREQSLEFTNLCIDKSDGLENQYVVFNIHLYGTEDEYEIMHLTNLAAKTTITKESTNINFLSTPLWFYDRVSLVHSTQRDLGNFVNKFKGIQIIITTNNNKYEMVK